jgi:hypothetical protein
MLAAHIDGEKNSYGAAPERFFSQLKHILKNGTFPEPIVIVPVKSGLSVRRPRMPFVAFASGGPP